MAQSTTSKSGTSQGFQVGELFCGAGGLSRGFHSLGFTPRFANDVWDVALHTFLMNFDATYAASGGRSPGEVLSLPGSVEKLDAEDILKRLPSATRKSMGVGDLDVLLGGPPCQGFSLNSHVRSATDPRNYLFRQYVRLLQGLAPRVFVLENVPGMLSLEDGQFFYEFLNAIRAPQGASCPGYDVDFKILNAAHYGVPQERFRIVVVGTRRDVADQVGMVELPTPVHLSFARAHFKGGRTHTFHYAIGHKGTRDKEVVPLFGNQLLAPRSVQDAIGDLPALSNGGGKDFSAYPSKHSSDAPLSKYQKEMRKGAKALTNHWCRGLMPPNTERVKYIPQGGDWRSLPQHLLPLGMQRALRKDHTKRYGRLSPTDLSGTILTKPDPHWGTFLHYDVAQQRLISVREAARIQSFPDTHIFFGGQVDQYKLCGNAVPALMARAIAVNVKEVLERHEERLEASPAAARSAPRARV